MAIHPGSRVDPAPPAPEAAAEPAPAPAAKPAAPAARRWPTAQELKAIPVTAGLAGIAIVVTVVYWMSPMPTLVMQGDLLHDAPWRSITSSLLHVNLLHLWFNVYWTLVLGAYVEHERGRVATLIGYLVAAFASATAEQGLAHGGVGLSGVVYAMFGYGWARARSDATWAARIDQGLVRSFAGWFLFCIATTVAGMMPVANVAHGVGALVGALAGWAVTDRRALVGLAVAIVLSAVVDVGPVRERVNFTTEPALEAEQRGLAALTQERYREAIRELEHATELAPSEGRLWHNLGVARSHVEDDREAACDAFRHASELDPGDASSARAAAECSPR